MKAIFQYQTGVVKIILIPNNSSLVYRLQSRFLLGAAAESLTFRLSQRSCAIEIEKERMESPKLTRKIVYEKKAAKYEGVGRFAHKLRQFYEFYLIAVSYTHLTLPTTPYV